MSAATAKAPPWHARLFDDSSPYVDRFGLLLGVVITTVVVLSLVDFVGPSAPVAQEIGSLLASGLVALTLLIALRASGMARRWRIWADVVIIGGIIALVLLVAAKRWFGWRTGIDVEHQPPALIVVLAVLAPLVVVRRLLQHTTVHRGTLMGAISAYLLIPVAYFYAFLYVNSFEGTGFFGSHQGSTSFMYFSLTTVTTTGYGDLTPQLPLARLLATSEAVVGQVYLVTFVAMLVGLAAQRWRGGRQDAAGSQPEDASA